jgi:3-(methylthio)propionyl---CoA ligase
LVTASPPSRGTPGGIWNAGTGIMGIGAICHTVNPRLFAEQIAWIVNDAQDRMIIADITFVPVLEQIAAKMPSVERYIMLTDKAHMPETKLKNAYRSPTEHIAVW